MKKKKKGVLKSFLVLITIGLLIYLGYFIFNALKEIRRINDDINEYNSMLLEHISELSEDNFNYINQINGSEQ